MENNKMIGLSQLQEYDKERQKHLATELKELSKDCTICVFKTTKANTSISIQFFGAENELEIMADWGDGESHTVNTPHIYKDIGEYICVIHCPDVVDLAPYLAGNLELTQLYVSDKVAYFMEEQFSDCYNLTYVKLGKQITGITGPIFWGCPIKTMEGIERLKSVGVMSLDGLAMEEVYFRDMEWTDVNSFSNSSLKHVIFGEKLESFYGGEFEGCNDLKTIEIKAINPPILSDDLPWASFGFPDSLEKIIVPLESLQAYKTASNWCVYADKIVAMVDTNYLEDGLAGKFDKPTFTPSGYGLMGTGYQNLETKVWSMFPQSTNANWIPMYDNKRNLWTETPQADNACANKKYVDDAIASLRPVEGKWYDVTIEGYYDNGYPLFVSATQLQPPTKVKINRLQRWKDDGMGAICAYDQTVDTAISGDRFTCNILFTEDCDTGETISEQKQVIFGWIYYATAGESPIGEAGTFVSIVDMSSTLEVDISLLIKGE